VLGTDCFAHQCNVGFCRQKPPMHLLVLTRSCGWDSFFGMKAGGGYLLHMCWLHWWCCINNQQFQTVGKAKPHFFLPHGWDMHLASLATTKLKCEDILLVATPVDVLLLIDCFWSCQCLSSNCFMADAVWCIHEHFFVFNNVVSSHGSPCPTTTTASTTAAAIPLAFTELSCP